MPDAPRPTVLVVDDVPLNLEVATGILKTYYRPLAATSGAKALELLARGVAVDLILLDVMMPGMSGFEVCQRLRENPALAHIPVIFLTALDGTDDERRAFAAGAVDFVNKPFQPETLLARVGTHLRLHAHERHLDGLVKARTAELEATRLQVIHQLGRAAEFKDDDTGTHVIRMAHYVRLIAEAAGLGQDRAELLFQAAPMHDIGKLGIPDAILKKPGRLTPEEFEVMKQHPRMGADILGQPTSELLTTARVIALTHHEKVNGQGYPAGLAGEAIPVEGRIAAIADVFDALTSARPYKAAWTVEDALAEMRRGAGAHFDAALLDAFTERLPDALAIKARYNEAVPFAQAETESAARLVRG